MKLYSLTMLSICVWPFGRMASIDMAFPRRCMCGWKFSTRPDLRITWKFCDTVSVFGGMSRLRLPPVMPL